MAFPDEVTDAELAFDIAQESLKGLKKDIKSDSKVKVKSLDVVYNDDDDTWQHIIKFDDDVQPQLMGMMATCLEVVANRTIVEFVPSKSKLVLSYSDNEPEEDGDES